MYMLCLYMYEYVYDPLYDWIYTKFAHAIFACLFGGMLESISSPPSSELVLLMPFSWEASDSVEVRSGIMSSSEAGVSPTLIDPALVTSIDCAGLP